MIDANLFHFSFSFGEKLFGSARKDFRMASNFLMVRKKCKVSVNIWLNKGFFITLYLRPGFS